jgi:ATP-dependent DNA helicase RecQ
MVVMPTGAGKSLIFQLPALLLPGLTVVVSPLIALMKDQMDKLEDLGVDAWTINSSLSARDQAATEDAMGRGDGEILYLTPERFRGAPCRSSSWTRRTAFPSGATTSVPTT